VTFTLADIQRIHDQLGHARVHHEIGELLEASFFFNDEYTPLARAVWDAEYSLIEVPWQRPGWPVLCGPEFNGEESLPVGLEGGSGHGDGLYGELVVDPRSGVGDYGDGGGRRAGPGLGWGKCWEYGQHQWDGAGSSCPPWGDPVDGEDVVRP
jgi:hypothetical protein